MSWIDTVLSEQQQVPVRTRRYKINRLPAGFRQYDEAPVTTAVNELEKRS